MLKKSEPVYLGTVIDVIDGGSSPLQVIISALVNWQQALEQSPPKK